MESLPPLREVIERHGIAAKRSFGQHFIFDGNLTGRIARAAGPLEGFTVYEPGAGPGGLTRSLLYEGAEKVIAVEPDRNCAAALRELADLFPGRLTVREEDALGTSAMELARIGTAGKVKIVANLPYNAGTALLIHWLSAFTRDRWFESMTLMFQKEVAERICAGPGTRTYGRLSIITQWLMEPRILFDVSPKAFVPPPKVTSSVVAFMPRAAPLSAASFGDLENVTRAAFGQRRKMLRSSLKQLGVSVDDLLGETDIEGTRRAEELSVEDFCALARTWRNMAGPSAPPEAL